MTNALVKNGLFGNLFCEPEIAGEFSAQAFLERMLAFQSAWTRALVATGIVSPEDAKAALQAFDQFDAVGFRNTSDRDGLPVPSLVAQLRSGLSPGAARAIHTGATSQDVIDTAMVLSALAVLDRLDRRLRELILTLADLERRHGQAPFMARTRMQAAMPAAASLRLSAWTRLVRTQQDHQPRLREEIARVQIGGAVGLRDLPDGQGERVANHVAETLGLGMSPVWHTERSCMVSLGNWLTMLSGALGKIAQDIALMAQQGLDEIELDGGGGSSAMPHKQNPVLAEATVAIARHVAGLQGTLCQAMIHEQERSGAAWSLEWLTLPAMAEASGAALRNTEELLGAIRRVGAPD